MPSSRVYIGRLPNSARERDVERFFKGYGNVREVILKNGYGFVVVIVIIIIIMIIFIQSNHTNLQKAHLILFLFQFSSAQIMPMYIITF